MKENHFVFLEKSFTVHLKPDGEICNRLKAGTKVYLCQIKGEWTKRTSTIGRNVSIITNSGIITGKASKIDNDGALVISKGKKITRLLVGDIKYH